MSTPLNKQNRDNWSLAYYHVVGLQVYHDQILECQNKHFRPFFKVIMAVMALPVNRNSKKMGYTSRCGKLLLLYASKQ